MEPIVLFISAVSVLFCIIVTIRTRVEKETDQESEKKVIGKPGIINDSSKDDDKTDYSTDWRTNNKNTLMETPKGTRDLFLETLTKIGCQYQLGEGEDDHIYFAYQGEHFTAGATNDSVYVQLWDTYWGHVELYDIDEVSRMRKAINKTNLNTSVTTVYTIDEDGKNMDVHSKTVIPFMSSMNDLDTYLRVELNEFFRAHQGVGVEMNKLREQEKCV